MGDRRDLRSFPGHGFLIYIIVVKCQRSDPHDPAASLAVIPRMIDALPIALPEFLQGSQACRSRRPLAEEFRYIIQPCPLPDFFAADLSLPFLNRHFLRSEPVQVSACHVVVRMRPYSSHVQSRITHHDPCSGIQRHLGIVRNQGFACRRIKIIGLDPRPPVFLIYRP